MQRLFAVFFLSLMMLLGTSAHAAKTAPIMSVEQARTAAAEKKLLLIDIRTPEEWRDSGIGDVAHPIDMAKATFVSKLLKLREANPGVPIGLICATGVRSRALGSYLIRNGITDVVDVSAGMHGRGGWLARKLPVKPAPTGN